MLHSNAQKKQIDTLNSAIENWIKIYTVVLHTAGNKQFLSVKLWKQANKTAVMFLKVV